jgi:formylglycine-generating enzyme required for sulfatase activity
VNLVGDIATLELGSGVALKLCWIPKGDFWLGSGSAERAWAATEGQAKPDTFREFEQGEPVAAQVAEGFWLGQTEVTVEAWRQFVRLASYRSDVEKGRSAWCYNPRRDSWGWDTATWQVPSFSHGARDLEPVTCISWRDAAAFCKWIADAIKADKSLPTTWTCRLPTEAEWEYACRCGKNTSRFWWGNALEEARGRLNAASDDARESAGPWPQRFPWSDGFPWVCEVDHFSKGGRNTFALADMLGNVAEWCLDEYDPKGAHAELHVGDARKHVFRGGSFADPPGHVRCASRGGFATGEGAIFIGFRICLGVRR